jgi:hypothetical protein
MATESWIPILSFVGGSGVTLAVEYLRSLSARADRRQAALERREDREADRSVRERERRLQLEDEHRTSQREVLTELQDKLSDFIRTVGKALHADQMAWKQAGQPDDFPVGQHPDEISVGLNTLQRRVRILAARVDDEQIRDGANALMGRVNDSLNARNSDRAWQVGSQAAEEFGDLNSRIGEGFRSLAVQYHGSKSPVREPTPSP